MPELQLFTNNASGKLAAGLGTADVVLTLEAGQGLYFPSPTVNQFFYLTLVDAASYIEIVKCTGRSGDTFSIVRGQEATAPREFAIGDTVELRVTAGSLGRFAQIDASHIITGLWEFSNNVAVPVVPTQAQHAASKQYVDSFVLTGHNHAGQTIGPVVLADGSTATTQAPGTNNTRVATTAFVAAALSGAGGGLSGIEILSSPTTFNIPLNSGNWYTVTLSGIPAGSKAALITGNLYNNIENGSASIEIGPTNGAWATIVSHDGYQSFGGVMPFLMPLTSLQFRTRRVGGLTNMNWNLLGYVA